MKIIGLDLGNRSGFACGDAGGKPRVEAWALKRKGDDVETACRNLSCSLRDNVQLENPDLIAVENYLHPVAQPSADVVITHLMMHGVIEAIAGVFGVRVVRPTAATIRAHFCGQASAVKRSKQPRDAIQRAKDREATNMMVVRRAIMLGYLPHGSRDWDKASAAAIWDYACATYARAAPARLALFGEEARA